MARLPWLGMMKDKDERRTWRACSVTPCAAAMSGYMCPSQSGASEQIRSGGEPSRAQANAAVTALPPKDTA
ncbi:hypothetical protein G6F51_014667 [Rhizopus arrhizus]|uniref:Uncharacterized protein n=1 Tax=Rhizopus oryzae TaxID=64495 RepID=A0A9P6XLB7_RHIOR|nr:hypothetical protein G6F51_014667 [Rhizopus arrhizus]